MLSRLFKVSIALTAYTILTVIDKIISINTGHVCQACAGELVWIQEMGFICTECTVKTTLTQFDSWYTTIGVKPSASS